MGSYVDEEQEPHHRPPPYGYMPSDFTSDQALGELDETLDAEGGAEALSPRQYAMLMNSMRDPLSMYTTTLAGAPDHGDPPTDHGEFVEYRPSPPPYNKFDPVNPLEGLGGRSYNVSPTYGHLVGVADGRGHAAEGGGDELHPMYTMMSSTHQPRPPTAPRNPQSRH